jgi:phenylacetate-CoA ligase
MAFQLKRRVYENLPASIKQSVQLLPFAWLAGRGYRDVLSREKWFDQAGREEVNRYQEQELRGVLEYATKQVPAYQHLRPIVERHSPFDALKSFPLLDKDTVQANPEDFLPRDFGKLRHYEASTGGTSGNQLKFFLDDRSQSVELGFMHRQWRRVGYTPGCRKATFRGVPFRNLLPGVFWQHNPIYNELQFSPFHMSEANLAAYVDRIGRYRPDFFHGYPSAIDVLAEYVLRHGLTNKLPEIRAVLLASEGATKEQRTRIERAFATRAYSWYGHSERLVLAGECERNSTYHHFPDYGILEIVDDQGNSCDQEGDRGEIVGTGFHNRCMPLIRYRTADSATRVDFRCECGRNWDRFTDVEGRWLQDVVIGKSGTQISIAALNMHGPLFERVVRYQYYQDCPGRCVLKLVVAPGFTEMERTAIEQAYNDKVGAEVEFRIDIVDDIPLTARGKHKMLDSRLEMPEAGVVK